MAVRTGTRKPGPTGSRRHLMTVEEFAVNAGVKDFTELVRGRVVQLSPAFAGHSDIAGAILAALRPYVKRLRLGRCVGEGAGFALARNPDTVRSPDVAFVSASRLPSGRFPSDHYPEGAPDLAVEVISSSNTRREIEAKVRDYFGGGARLVWVVYPEQRLVHVHRADGTDDFVREPGSLSGEDVVPGFELPLTDVFE